MRNLLMINFIRMFKSKLFWGGLVFTLLFAVYTVSDQHTFVPMEDLFFYLMPFMGAYSAVLTSMFVGTDYSDGTIRNKLVVGQSRTSVFFANGIVTMCATFIMLAVWFAVILCAKPLIVHTQSESSLPLILGSAIAVLNVVAYAALFTAVSMCVTNKTNSVLVSIGIYIALILAASYFVNILSQPELLPEYEMTIDGIDASELVPNPNYVEGTTRMVYDFIADVLPSGQGIRLSWVEFEHPVRMMVSSVILSAVFIAGGLVLFRKKDLK